MGFFKKKAPVEPEGEKRPSSAGNPYLNARTEWLERYGSYISRAAQWRAVAFISLIIAVMSIACNVIQANQVKTVPYIIEVDKLGKSIVVNRADTASAAPCDWYRRPLPTASRNGARSLPTLSCNNR